MEVQVDMTRYKVKKVFFILGDDSPVDLEAVTQFHAAPDSLLLKGKHCT